MRKILFTTGVLAAFALLAAAAISARPDTTPASSAQAQPQNVETSVVRETVRVKPDNSGKAPAPSATSNAAPAGSAPAPAQVTANRGDDDRFDDDRFEDGKYDDDRHEPAEREDHDEDQGEDREDHDDD